MKSLGLMLGAAGALAAAGMGFPGTAAAAPSGPLTAAQTVGDLQAQGFHVILNRTGAGALDHCVVNSVRPGQTFSRMDSGAPGAMDDIVTTVTAKTVYVDVTC